MVIAVRHAVQPTVTKPHNNRAPALSALTVEFAHRGFRDSDRPENVHTGPPVDLIVTLGHLLI
jgi:hypothetical protein